MKGDTVSLVIILFCVLGSGYFSATETAFSSFNRIRVKNMAEKNNKKARLVLKLSDNYDSLLSTILIGNNIVNILCASMTTMLFVDWIGTEAGPSVSTIVTTIVVLIFGEVTPKSVAKESPEKFAMFSAPILNVFVIVLTPFNFLFGLWKKFINKIFKSNEDRSITEEELITIVSEAENEGGIDQDEGLLIRSAIEFSEVEVKDIITPRIDIVGIQEDTSKEKIAEIFTETGYSRLPVYKESLDRIIGIVYHKDFYNYVYNTDKTIKDIIRPALFVTKNKKIDDLLKELQQKKSHIAVVLDEYAGTIGIVTLEDIVEELVGEIWDEHDEVVQEIVEKSETEYEVLGSADIEDVFDKFGISEKVTVQTISGWVMETLEKIPEVGDTFTYKNIVVSVLEMDDNRVERVNIKINTEEL